MKQQNSPLSLCLVAGLLCMSFACRCQPAATIPGYLKTLQKNIEAINEQYFNAFERKDPALFQTLYTYDCWIMAPNAAIFCGPDAASDYFTHAVQQTGIKTGKFITVDVFGLQDSLVAELGFYQLFNANHQQFDGGKYLVLWKKEGSTWKRFRDIFNSSHDTSLEEAKKAIAESNAIYFQSFAKNDPAVFIDRYAEDACIMAPFAPQACGKDQVAKFFKEAYDVYGLRNGKFITTAVYGNSDGFMTEEGLWQSVNDKGELFDDGKFLVLWKNTKNGWKMFRDSFSSNRKK